jgi:phosphoribosyl-ATP pyrophosphohydrolase
VARTKKKPAKSLVRDRIVELETAIAAVRDGQKTSPRTARLLAAGLPRVAQKLAEEAMEVVIERFAGSGRRSSMRASTDL